MTIGDKLAKIPPFVCRLVARTSNSQRGLSHNEITQRSKLNRSTVKNLSVATTWNGYTIETILAFALACGVNHLAAGKQLDFLKRRKWLHVKNARGSQAALYQRLKRLLVEEAKKRIAIRRPLSNPKMKLPAEV